MLGLDVVVEEVENSIDEWNFKEEGEVIVNGSVVKAVVSGKLTPKINQISVNIAILGDGGTLIFKGSKQP